MIMNQFWIVTISCEIVEESSTRHTQDQALLVFIILGVVVVKVRSRPGRWVLNSPTEQGMSTMRLNFTFNIHFNFLADVCNYSQLSLPAIYFPFFKPIFLPVCGFCS